MVSGRGELFLDAGLQLMAEAFEAHVKGSRSRASGCGEVFRFDARGVGVEEKVSLLLGKLLEALLEGGVLLAAELEFLFAFPPDEIENVLAEDQPVARDLSAIRQCFEPRNDTGPFHEGSCGIVLIKLPPNHERGLLEDIGGVGRRRNERTDKAPEVRFMTRVKRHEFLVAGVVFLL